MDKKPELKSFIRYGGAFCFENVHVEFEHGRRATLTIFHDGREEETVDLQSIETEEEMVKTMLDKGFLLKDPQEVARIKQIGAEAKVREEGEKMARRAEMERKLEAYRNKRMEAKRQREAEEAVAAGNDPKKHDGGEL